MRTLFALAALAVFAPAAEAGPIRDRLRARFAPRPACVPTVSAPAPVVAPQAVPVVVPAVYTVPASCPNGQCPLIRR